MLMRSLRMMMLVRPLFIDNPGRRRCGCRTGWDNCGYRERRKLLMGIINDPMLAVVLL